MERHRFYTPNYSLTSEIASGSGVILNEEESHHACKVLRMAQGDKIELVNGKGWIAEAEIVDAHPKRSLCKLIKVYEGEDNAAEIHLAIAPPKNIGRFEWLLEKSTEIGIHSITPVFCQHSERQHLKAERLEKILVSAMKQSKRSWKPLLHKPVLFNALLKGSLPELKLMAYMDEGSKNLGELYQKETRVVILVGPEGDFSHEEVEQARDAGFRNVLLGNSRLRTETAGLYACAAINVLNDFYKRETI